MGNNTVGTARDNGCPVIEDDVEVGCGARILGPVRIGARAVIGANAVVLADVPADALAVGAPARIITRPERRNEQGLQLVRQEHCDESKGCEPMNPRISVVIATRDRGRSVVRLVGQLNAQALDADDFEIIVVDDGSREPAEPMLDRTVGRIRPRVRRIPWSGQAVVRHEGALMARGRILVFLDDDMQVGPAFLAAQLARHEASPRAVVLGRIRPDPDLGRMPLFERYHARQLDRWRASVMAGRVAARGIHLCTGNVSMTRNDYLAVGGFDPTLKRSEDRELGIRLDKSGCRFVYADEVESVHCSDHASLSVWLRRAYLYGRFDLRIAALHTDMPLAHPWKFWALIHPLSRPIVALALLAPRLGRALSRAAYVGAWMADLSRLRGLALTLTAFSYALEYFSGLRDEYGSFRAFWHGTRAGSTVRVGAFRSFREAIRADHDAIRRAREKYRGETISSARLPTDLMTKVGFQMLAAYRVMRLLVAWRVPLAPMVVSRLIRHLYGAEIHWNTRIAPGVCIVHGVGLVLSHGAEIGEGCILFHNVTLGESRDPRTGVVGAPRLGRSVHVGPGVTLLGPIEIGAGSKVAAGAVLMRTIPPGSLVAPAEPVVTSRRRVVDHVRQQLPQAV